MTSPRRLAIFVAGAVATVTLVAVGPGDMALGAKAPAGGGGANSPGTGPGAAGADDIGRGSGGRTGRQGPDGADGARLPGGRRGDGLDGVEVDVPRVRGARNTKGLRGRLTRQIQRQVRNDLQNSGVI